MDKFRRLVDVHVKGSLACIEAMCLLRQTSKDFDSDSYACMEDLCKAFAHFADQITVFAMVPTDELPEMPEE